MSRALFFSVASAIAISVGFFALVFPQALLQSKGVQANAATSVWVTEVGILLIVTGTMLFLIRRHKNSPILNIFLWGNAAIQAGLFAIELVAYSNTVITKLSGVLPNLCLHVLLATGFVYFALKKKKNEMSC